VLNLKLLNCVPAPWVQVGLLHRATVVTPPRREPGELAHSTSQTRSNVELEVTLGASEPTLAEYILDKYEVSHGSAAAFRSTLQKEAGIDGIHVDRLHLLITTLKVFIFPSEL